MGKKTRDSIPHFIRILIGHLLGASAHLTRQNKKIQSTFWKEEDVYQERVAFFFLFKISPSWNGMQ